MPTRIASYAPPMPLSPPRTMEERKTDTLARLQAAEADVWVATASVSDTDPATADAHLVPLSIGWVDERIVLAIEPRSRTARNLCVGAHARLGLGPTRDLAMIDAVVQSVVDAADLPAGVGEAYAAQSGWDPRQSSVPFVFVTLRPVRIQAWREANELPGRTLMRDGAWLA
jgi:hypothetical protein